MSRQFAKQKIEGARSLLSNGFAAFNKTSVSGYTQEANKQKTHQGSMESFVSTSWLW